MLRSRLLAALATVVLAALLSPVASASAATNTGILAGAVSGPTVSPNGVQTAIRLFSSANGGEYAYQTVDVDSSGAFSFRDLAPGNYSVQYCFYYLTTANFCSKQFYGGGASPITATYVRVDNQTVTLDTTAQLPFGSIKGRVVDPAGNPVQNASIAVYQGGTRDRQNSVVTEGQSDKAGNYEIDHLNPGSYTLGFNGTDGITYDTDRNEWSLHQGTPFLKQWNGGVSSYVSAAPVTVSANTSTSAPTTRLQYLGSASREPEWAGETVGSGNPSETTCQQCHGDPVSTATGEFYDSKVDLSMPGARGGVQLTRFYSTANAMNDGPFGYGSTASFSSQVKTVEESPYYGEAPRSIALVQENGSIARYTSGSRNGYATAERIRTQATPTYNTGSGAWSGTKFVYQDQRTATYDTDGRLIETGTLSGSAVRYAYDEAGVLRDITDILSGRTITLTWTNAHVTKATDSTGRSATYDYDASGNLSSFTDPAGAQTTISYDSQHRVTSVTPAGGGSTANTYDTNSRVIKQVDPLGRVTTFDYADGQTTVTVPSGTKRVLQYFNSLLVRETVAAGSPEEATTLYSFDNANNLMSLTDPLGNQTRYTYDAQGHVLSIAEPNYRTTKFEYDSPGNVSKVTDAAGRSTVMTYDDQSRLLSLTSPGGRKQTWAYGSDGTTTSMTNPAGGVTKYSYNDTHDLSTTTDASGSVTTTDHDLAGFVTGTRDALGVISRITLDKVGRTLSSTDGAGNVTSYVYDAAGNLTSVVDPLGQTQSKGFNAAGENVSDTDVAGGKTTYMYDQDGLLSRTTDPLGRSIAYSRDKRGNVVATTDGIGRTSTFTYDLLNRRTTSKSPTGATTSLAYDAVNNVIQTTDAVGAIATFEYSADNRLVVATDSAKRSTVYGYAPDGEITQVSYPNNTSETSTYSSLGLPISFTNKDGKTTSYEYDSRGLLQKETRPGGLSTTYAYDARGNLTLTTRPDGTSDKRTVNGNGQVTQIQNSTKNAVDESYTYDALGRRTKMVDSSGTTTYSYTKVGQLASSINGAGQAMTYSYDAAGQTTGITYPGAKKVSYAYDAAGQMTAVSDWLGNKTTFGWTGNGRLASQATPNGVTQTFTYDAADRATKIVATTKSATLGSYGTTYSSTGNVAADTSTDPVATSLARSYAYDAIDQLKSVKTGSATTTYTSSAAGLLTKAANGDTQTYNAAEQVIALKPTSGPSTSYTYDANGARSASTVAASGSTAAATTKFTYTLQGGLASVTPSTTSANVVKYTENGDGLRQSRTKGTSSTSKYLWDLHGDLPLLVDDGAKSYVYGPESNPIYQIDTASGAVQYLTADLVGSTRLITNASGAVVSANAYDAFGKRTAHTGTVDSAIGFSGNLTDPDTGLVYLRTRDYDPTTRQFLTVDPLTRDTATPYAYTYNNPLNHTDPSGLWSLSEGWDWYAENWQAGADQIVLSDAGLALGDALTTGWTGKVTSLVVGFGDGASLGLTAQLTDAIAPTGACQVRSNAGWYTTGTVLGTVATTVASAGSTGPAVRPVVSNPKLANIIKNQFKGGESYKRIGDGTTASAIRWERATGKLVGGKNHMIKGKQDSNGLRNLLKGKSGPLSEHDRQVAQALLDDLQNAMGG